MKKWISIILFTFLANSVFCQNVVDSLLKEIQTKKITETIANKALLIPYDKIVNDLNRSLIIFESISKENIFKNNSIKLGDLNELLALVYYLKGNYAFSSNLHLKSIKLFEQAGDERRKANAMATLAYEGKKRNLKSSLRMMSEAIQILKKLNAKSDLSSAIDNYGVLFEMSDELDSAMYYYKEALRLKTESKDSVGIPYSLNNIAGVYFMKNNIPEGLNFINQSTEIRKRIHDYIGMSWNEFSLGELYMSLNDNIKAKEHFQKSYSLSMKASYPDLNSRNLKSISMILAKQKKYDSAYFYFTQFFNIHDSLYNAQTQKQLLEMETLFETEKKSSQIILLDKENKLQENELDSKRKSQILLLFILSLSLIAGAFIYKAYRQKIAASKIISQQKVKVEKQKELIEEKQKEIMDSINYAKRIQYALLADEKLLEGNLTSHFIFFKPKDIVSGDFYWATEYEDDFYLAVCDSTGHGVPGAFMSLLSIGFLSEAIKEKNIQEPNKVFDYVRKRLIESISSEEQKDGFDGILLRINKITGKVTYAAANNRPVLMSGNEIQNLSCDKMPVGKGEKLTPFSEFEIIHTRGDTIYLYTDGYADQFGGEKGKKFKYKPLNELLTANSALELKQQSVILDQQFSDWKGNLEQVDDVLVIGIKL